MYAKVSGAIDGGNQMSIARSCSTAEISPLRLLSHASYELRSAIITTQPIDHKVSCLRETVMPKPSKKPARSKTQPETLKGWQQIAAFLGEPTSVVQRWASDGMPVRRQGRYVETTPDELNAWLGKESGKPVHVATEDTDLTAELKRGLSFVRREKEPTAGKELSALSKKAKRK